MPCYKHAAIFHHLIMHQLNRTRVNKQECLKILRTDCNDYACYVAKILDLIEHGIIKVGTQIYWNRRVGNNFSAEVLANGKIKTSDGRSHKSPSGAARSLIGRPVDGWKVWRTSDGTSLYELRDKLTLKTDCR